MTRDLISLAGMVFFAHHGARPEERTLGQRFVVDVDLWVDLAAAGASDTLCDTVNYSRVFKLVDSVMHGDPVNLLETLGERIASRTLEDSDGVERVRVRIAKPGVAIAESILREAAVTIDRSRTG